MKRALSLAVRGWGRVAPNPMVGAVLLRDGEIVGEGYHSEYGGEHAEVAALATCDDPSGVTCVLNLEPCTHHGKTPPCTDALIAAGVERVVFAVSDPDPRAGGGGQVLRGAGVDVVKGECSRDAAALNAPFLWGVSRPERPFVALKLAGSLDGFSADDFGKSQWISSTEAREYVHWLRAGFDAVGVGLGTAEADDPELTARGGIAPRIPPKRVVFSRSGLLGVNRKVAQTAGDIPTFLTVGSDSLERAKEALQGTEVRVVKADDIQTSLAALRTAGVRSILVEGGAKLASVLLDSGLVDRIYWIQAPILLGRGTPSFGTRQPVHLDEANRWVPTERKPLGDGTLLVVDRELCLQE